MVCENITCGYMRGCRFNGYQYELCHYQINLCPLYNALQENARLKKQIADGGLEEKAKEDKRLEDARLLRQIGLN